ncbi:ATP/GTP-binding protein [uncultured Deefgea sp.]|uniref:AAA family ATPase n=1 Tax=uncultured Deefgea sp. TaxID=1304914 RepID=UPI002595F1E4|nr:ATP-binding protein [uncultured Deefgea sp.]
MAVFIGYDVDVSFFDLGGLFMLIEFSVTNYKSIHKRQTLSMVAAPKLRKKNNTFQPSIEGEKNFPALLKVAAIYGPNASGKSTLLDALNVFYNISLREPSAQSSQLPVQPFRFCTEAMQKPSEFEIHFFTDGKRYSLYLSATPDRIHEEKLITYIKGEEVQLYSRMYKNDVDVFTFGKGLGGDDGLHQIWAGLTGPRILFISQVVANSSNRISNLDAPFLWLSKGLTVWDNSHFSGLALRSQKLAKNHEQLSNELSSFLSDVDVPISHITFDDAKNDDLSENYNRLDQIATNNNSNFKTKFVHKTSFGSADFLYNEESKGTQALIGFWLPLSVSLSKNTTSTVLVVDELDSSLHSLIVAKIIKKIIASEHPIQLIFTTHDTHLMDAKILRRDQFWLTERDMTGATQLRCIYDFEGRESEDIEKRYYEGRYRSLPLVRGE